jgi:hypothetical protein
MASLIFLPPKGILPIVKTFIPSTSCPSHLFFSSTLSRLQERKITVTFSLSHYPCSRQGKSIMRPFPCPYLFITKASSPPPIDEQITNPLHAICSISPMDLNVDSTPHFPSELLSVKEATPSRASFSGKSRRQKRGTV